MKTMTTNCYHTRDRKDGVKLTGGMLHAKSMDEAQERAVCGLTVKIMWSRAVFVDQQGREVSLYLSVHPEHTSLGQKALAEYRAAEQVRRDTEEAERTADEEKLACLVSKHGIKQAIINLSTPPQ